MLNVDYFSRYGVGLYLTYAAFEKLDSFPSSGGGGLKDSSELDPVERAQLTKILPPFTVTELDS
jgi:hypothetical protein